MRKLSSILLALALASAAPAAGQAGGAGGETAADSARIRDARAAWVRAFNARDSLALLASYTSDVTFINASGRVLVAADLPAFYRGALMTFSDIAVEVLRLEVQADLAYEIARYRDTFQPPGATPIPHGGTQLVVWRREQGAWKQAAVMVNSAFSRLVVPGSPGR